jgi:exosome complex RNA-binding protein Csl4
MDGAVVMPGDALGSEDDFELGSGVIKRDGEIVACLVGRVARQAAVPKNIVSVSVLLALLQQ